MLSYAHNWEKKSKTLGYYWFLTEKYKSKHIMLPPIHWYLTCVITLNILPIPIGKEAKLLER